MDIAEMKPVGKGKASAPIDEQAMYGEALAHACVEYAWQEARVDEERGRKLQRFVKDICALPSPEAHNAFRNQLKMELDSIRAMEAASGIKESNRAGYSLNSFVVMVSYLRGISIACGLGFTGKRPDGTEMYWTEALEAAKEVRSAHANNTGARVTADGRALGGGRKAHTDLDKAMRLVGKLNLRDLRKLKAVVDAAIEGIESKRPAKKVAIAA